MHDAPLTAPGRSPQTPARRSHLKPETRNKRTPMRILLVEPEDIVAASLELGLKAEGFAIYRTDRGDEAIDLGKLYDYDAILIELNLPDMSGLDVIRSLRMAKVGTPILVVTSNYAIDAKIMAFGYGADDYIPKPFHKDEVVARIHAVVRRSHGTSVSVITVGDLDVYLDRKVAEVRGRRVHLTAKEYGMLELLMLRRGHVVTKEMFLNHLYGGTDEPELKIIDVFICKLRKKFKPLIGHRLVETVWGRGYSIEKPREAADGSSVADFVAENGGRREMEFAA